MTIDPRILGFEYPRVRRDYDERDTILYALGVGAGRRGDELRFVYEQGLEALPTFPVAPPFGALMLMEEALGVDLATVLHGEQRLTLHRSVPASGHLDIRAYVSRLYDKGSGAIIETTAEVEVDDLPVATAVYSSFVRGGGGFGGERGSGLAPPDVARPADHVLTETIPPTQAQLYRLSGDVNPLHVDPAVARAAGFGRPILHGLCTYGFAVRMAAQATGGAVTRADARFTGVVFPGDELRVEVWELAPETTYARVTVPQRAAVAIDPLEISTTPGEPSSTPA